MVGAAVDATVVVVVGKVSVVVDGAVVAFVVVVAVGVVVGTGVVPIVVVDAVVVVVVTITLRSDYRLRIRYLSYHLIELSNY